MIKNLYLFKIALIVTAINAVSIRTIFCMEQEDTVLQTNTTINPLLQEALRVVNDDNIDKLQELIGRGLEVRAIKDEHGCTLLHIAAQRGHTNLAKILITQGADVNAQETKSGETPLHQAIQQGHKETVKLLIDHHAELEKEDVGGATPLCTAASSKKCREIISMLIDRGAHVNFERSGKDSPLHYAVSLSKPKTVRLLLSRGASLNAINENNKTPLMLAQEIVNNSHKKDDCNTSETEINDDNSTEQLLKKTRKENKVLQRLEKACLHHTSQS